MRKIIFLLLCLVSCLPNFADQRGVTFEKDGLIYTIASEYVIRRVNVNRKTGDPTHLILNEGEVYVSGVSATDGVVVIPTAVTYPSTYCRTDTTTAKYSVMGIGEKAFENARLKDLVIPYGLRFIGKEAFRNIEITNGVLVVPPVRRIRADVFDGVKSKVLFMALEDSLTNLISSIYFDKTFQTKDRLPEFYIQHSDLNVSNQGIDKSMLYTVGSQIYRQWINTSWSPILKANASRKSYRSKSFIKTRDEGTFHTFSGDNLRKVPVVFIKKSRLIEKTGTDIDMLAPYEYSCWNPYTQKRDTYREFAINGTLYRGKKGEDYYYFTLDGKPITNTESLLDEDGKDPFGLQVLSDKELKAKKAAKQRSSDLNKRVNDLKNVFGF